MTEEAVMKESDNSSQEDSPPRIADPLFWAVYRYDRHVEDFVLDGVFTLETDAQAHFDYLAGVLTSDDRPVKPFKATLDELLDKEIKDRIGEAMPAFELLAKTADQLHHDVQDVLSLHKAAAALRDAEANYSEQTKAIDRRIPPFEG